jgi:uncharacterized membrane protein
MGLSKCEEMRKFYNSWLVTGMVDNLEAFKQMGDKIKMNHRKTTSGEVDTLQLKVFT